ncbi:Uracil-DNA glycosylase, partial [Schistosoma japonicum]
LHLSPSGKTLKGRPIVRSNVSATKRSYSELTSLSSLPKQQEQPIVIPIDVDLDRLADVEKSADTSDNLISRYPLTTKCATSHPPPYTHAASFDKQGTLDSTETSHTTSKTGIIDLDLCRSGLSTSSSSSLIGNSLRITCRADGPIHFASADPGNGLIRIYNASQRVINLSNWHLYVGPTHEGSLDYVKLYTFPKSQILQPHAELQVFLCWASEASQVSSPKRRRRDITAVLHLITPVSVWNPHSSVIALQDSTGAVRATCEMESCCKKIKKMPKSLVVGGTDEENGSSDKVSSVDSDEELHSFDDPQQPTIGEDDNNKNESVIETIRLTETTRTVSTQGEYFDLPQRVSSVRFSNNIWPNEASTNKISQSGQRTLTSFFSRTSTTTTPVQGKLKRKHSSSESEGNSDTPKLLISDENTPPSTGTVPSPTKTFNSKPTSLSSPLCPIGNTKRLCKSIETDKITVNKIVAECRRRLSNRSNKNVLNLIQGISTEWFAVLLEQIEHDKFQQLADFITKEQNSSVTIYPPIEQIFTWTKLCLPTDIRVVILGQDPYHGPRQAHGLAFSVCRPVPAPPSLINMYKEISSSMNLVNSDNWPPKHGDLTGWAKQGVLLLNAVLTVRASMPNSHKDKGWEFITDAAIRYLNKNRCNLVFMLWGASAQKQGQSLDRKRHLVLNAPHPSPLSASRGFFGCGHFIKANEYLKQHNIEPVDWTKLN